MEVGSYNNGSSRSVELRPSPRLDRLFYEITFTSSKLLICEDAKFHVTFSNIRVTRRPVGVEILVALWGGPSFLTPDDICIVSGAKKGEELYCFVEDSEPSHGRRAETRDHTHSRPSFLFLLTA